MTGLICYVWGSTGITWADADWIWSQCLYIALPVSVGGAGVDATVLLQPWITEPWNPYRAGEIEKRKRLIKLICKIKGETYEEEKTVGDMKISIDDVKMIIKKVFNIDVDVELGE